MILVRCVAALLAATIAAAGPGGGVAQEQRRDFGATREVIEPFNSYVTVYDDDNIEPMRPDIFGTHGVVATGNYAATLVGIEEFKRGGNAFDVGVAAAMAVKATTFDIAGWSGVAPLILYSAAEDRVVTRIGAGTAPVAATLENYLSHGKDPAHSAILPADVDVWLAALDRYGTKSFAEVARYLHPFAAVRSIRLSAPSLRDTIKDQCWKKFNKPSMLQHMEAGKQTEIDALNGAAVRLGAECGVATPYNEAVTLLIKGREAARRIELMGTAPDYAAMEAEAATVPRPKP